MSKDRYGFHPLILTFKDENIDRAYREYVYAQTHVFCQLAWAIVAVLGSAFYFLDEPLFGEKAGSVTAARFALVAFSLVVLGSTFSKSLKALYEWNACLFLLSVGGFCIYLTALESNEHFTPHFTGLVFALAGICSTPGLGFRRSILVLPLHLLLFNVALGILYPVPIQLLVVYNFFFMGVIVVFAYLGYLVERVSRVNFAVSEDLRHTVAHVRQLSELLPICSHCRKIRDNEGNWHGLEEHIRDNTGVTLSHGVCPDCAEKHYPDYYPRRITAE